MKKKLSNLPNTAIVAIIIFLLLIIVAIFATIFTNVSRAGKIAVTVKYAPFDSIVHLNGTKIKNNAVNYLSPGEYELTANLNHFTTSTETITISNDTEYILGKLIPSDSEGEDIMNENQKDYLTVEGIHGQLSTAAGEEIKQKYPILQYLPINNNLYSISFAYRNDGSPQITIKTDVKFIDIAISKLLLLDVKLTDYDIISTLDNPFLTPVPNTNTNPKNFIQASYPNIIDYYQISEGKISGDYYLTTIYTHNAATADSYGHYKVILKKINDSWEFASTPQFLLTTKNSPNLPETILSQANNI